MHIFNNPNFDFLRWRWHAIALSWIIIIAGGITLATKGIPRGVEFAGGTVVIEQFDQAVSVEQVRTALDRNYPDGGQNAVVQSYGDPALRMVMIRVPQVGAESGASLSTTAQQVEEALKQGQPAAPSAGRVRKSSARRSVPSSSARASWRRCCRSSASCCISRSGSNSASVSAPSSRRFTTF